MTATPRIVVGASHAGAELAVKLRQLDAATPLLVLGDEPFLPYQRPPLSKTWLANATGDVDWLLIRNAAAYVASTDRGWPFSFENLCDALGMDANALRDELRVTRMPA